MPFEPEIKSSLGLHTQRQVEALFAAPKYFGDGVAKEAVISTGITVSYAIIELPSMHPFVGAEQVVLIAGFMQPKDTWAHFIDVLLTKWNRKQRGVGLNILVMDNRGFGGTDAPFGMYSTRTMAEDILALMDHIGWRSAHIVGGSLGGMIAQELALLDLRRVCSLTLVSTSRDRYKASGRSLGLMVRKTFSFKSVTAKANSMVDTLFPSEWVDSTIIVETGESVRSAIARMYELQLRKWPEPSVSGVMGQTAAVQTHFVSDERLRNVNNAGFPILIVSAMLDDVIPAAESIALKEQLNGEHVRTLFFDIGGHGAIHQYADDIASEIIETMMRAAPPL
ncbi:serine protease family [Plasmopara halstedii]|uniref:Serine protease family n=1 Tax=Plasmopara halstedii TaxID=4781 RepID=A0A0P1A9B1_PLAHL|nr:serine protease family [Plasmopara halstedii]CEG36833.1 serine protease family [Plasmopara halstedii]|eukprot:XP_024573202.1 serine protease family [Plasmopara halstedii]